MSKRIDLKGKFFGCLEVISFSHTDKYFHTMWNCKCIVCGAEKVVSKSNLEKHNHDTYKSMRFYMKNDYCVGKNHYGDKFIFDEKYLSLVEKHTWHINDSGYVVTNCNKGNKKTILRLHRLISGCGEEKIIDHKNHDLLDNRECNLRICGYKDNNRNRKKIYNKHSSEFKGVHLDTRKNKRWISTITYNNKSIHIGTYSNEIDAAKAYNEKAIELFGEFAYLNDV